VALALVVSLDRKCLCSFCRAQNTFTLGVCSELGLLQKEWHQQGEAEERTGQIACPLSPEVVALWAWGFALQRLSMSALLYVSVQAEEGLI
jgi:hypothetical protein